MCNAHWERFVQWRDSVDGQRLMTTAESSRSRRKEPTCPRCGAVRKGTLESVALFVVV
jgi:hypothetical protein